MERSEPAVGYCLSFRPILTSRELKKGVSAVSEDGDDGEDGEDDEDRREVEADSSKSRQNCDPGKK